MSQGARAEHGLWRAAAAPSVGRRVRPQLEGHGHDLVARVERKLGGGGAVHSTAHRDERPARPARERRGAVPAAAPRRGRASAASSAAWRCAGRRPPSAAATSSGVMRAASRKSERRTARRPHCRRRGRRTASKPASTTRPLRPSPPLRIRSPQAAPWQPRHAASRRAHRARADRRCASSISRLPQRPSNSRREPSPARKRSATPAPAGERADDAQAPVRRRKRPPGVRRNREWRACLAAGVLRGGPRPYHEPVTHLGGVRLNGGRLAHRLGPESTLAAMT